jgi:hypothetical protein
MLLTRSSDKATHQPTSTEGALFHGPGCNPGYTKHRFERPRRLARLGIAPRWGAGVVADCDPGLRFAAPWAVDSGPVGARGRCPLCSTEGASIHSPGCNPWVRVQPHNRSPERALFPWRVYRRKSRGWHALRYSEGVHEASITHRLLAPTEIEAYLGLMRIVLSPLCLSRRCPRADVGFLQAVREPVARKAIRYLKDHSRPIPFVARLVARAEDWEWSSARSLRRTAAGEAGNGRERVKRVGNGITRLAIRQALRSTSGRATPPRHQDTKEEGGTPTFFCARR